MGILREKELPPLLRVEDVLDVEAEINYADFIFDEESASEADEPPKVDNSLPSHDADRLDATCKQRCKKDFKRGFRYAQRQKSLMFAADGLNVRNMKHMGANKLRRIENARLLMSFTDPQDIQYDGSDLIPETITAFSRLFNDAKNMKVWNEFIELDESDQQQILADIDEASRPGAKLEDAKMQKASTSSEKEDSLRAHHPAFSAQVCFNRMDKKFRDCFMKNRNLPLDFMERTEEELRNFFESAPRGVYVEALKSKMKRYYFHAMAQFLSLTSKSFADDSPSPGKIIQVTNGQGHFSPPSTFLVAFISERRCQFNKTLS